MNEAIQTITRKFPAFEYFDVLANFDSDSIQLLASELHLDAKTMSPQAKSILKKVREMANKAEAKVKEARKLYRFLSKKMSGISEIILSIISPRQTTKKSNPWRP